MKKFLISYFFILFFTVSYTFYSTTLSINYFDEVLWVGRSYFFELYLNRNFSHPAWKSFESYDQPKLAEYAYGFWLYPTYLKEKTTVQNQFSYNDFLSGKGFHAIGENEEVSLKKENILREISFSEKYLDQEIDLYVRKYGSESIKPINLIYQARTMNIILLVGAVIFAYHIVSLQTNQLVAAIFTVFYGFNNLIINSGLRAHSEALFLLTFNAAFYFLNLYFINGRKLSHLLWFSLLSGLCLSTKLNGAMLAIIFFAINSLFLLNKNQNKLIHFLKGLLPTFISLGILIILNPFTYIQPLKNTLFLFSWRMRAAASASEDFSSLALSDNISRIKIIFQNFFGKDLSSFFNGIKIFENQPIFGRYERFLIVFFLIGLAQVIKLVLRKKIAPIIMLVSFLLILIMMSEYLMVNWYRYYAHLPLFFIFFEIVGIKVVFDILSANFRITKNPS